jgi:hypothetical protein
MKRAALLTFLPLVFLLGLLQLQTFSAGAKDDDQGQPIVSGVKKGNTGCVILGKHMPVKGKLLLAGVVYARTEYDVLETFNYKMEKQKFTGRGEIDDLNQRALKDKIKLVVIPEKHTPEQLQEARKICRE